MRRSSNPTQAGPNGCRARPGQPFTQRLASKMRAEPGTKSDQTPHAIDATDNIDHARGGALGVHKWDVRGQDGLAAHQRRRVPELLGDRRFHHIATVVGKAHLHVRGFGREEGRHW